MTPEERFEAHEQWLLDHDKALAKHERDMTEIRATLAETVEIQRKQAGVLLELTQHVTRLLERWEDNGNEHGRRE